MVGYSTHQQGEKYASDNAIEIKGTSNLSTFSKIRLFSNSIFEIYYA